MGHWVASTTRPLLLHASVSVTHSPAAQMPRPDAHVTVLGSGWQLSAQHPPLALGAHCAPSASWQPVQHTEPSSQASPGSTTPLPHMATGTQIGPLHNPSVPVLAMHFEWSGTFTGGVTGLHAPLGAAHRISHPLGGQTIGENEEPVGSAD